MAGQVCKSMNKGPSWGPKTGKRMSVSPSKAFKSVAVEKEQKVNANRKENNTSWSKKKEL